MAKVVLASLRKRRGFRTYEALAAQCRKYHDGETITGPLICSYLQGQRAVPERHLRLLCYVLRIARDEVLTSTYLAGGRQEPEAA